MSVFIFPLLNVFHRFAPTYFHLQIAFINISLISTFYIYIFFQTNPLPPTDLGLVSYFVFAVYSAEDVYINDVILKVEGRLKNYNNKTFSPPINHFTWKRRKPKQLQPSAAEDKS